jgi:hypothetical protein
LTEERKEINYSGEVGTASIIHHRFSRVINGGYGREVGVYSKNPVEG